MTGITKIVKAVYANQYEEKNDKLNNKINHIKYHHFNIIKLFFVWIQNTILKF